LRQIAKCSVEAVVEQAIRRGLVIAGGGAKGAYAFGCLLALRRRRYKFDVVAGTSAGALNAAIWATGRWRLGWKLWSNLSFASTYPVRDPRIRHLPSILQRSLGGLFFTARVVLTAISNIPVSRPIRIVASLLLAVLYCVLVLHVPALSKERGMWVPVAFLGLMLFLGLSQRLTHRFMLFDVPLGFTAMIVAWPLTGVVSPSWPVVGVLTVIVTAFLVLLGFHVLVASIVYLSEGTTFLENTPLGKHLTDLCCEATFRAPTYATVARLVKVFDPDDEKWWSMDGYALEGKYSSSYIWQPALRPEWIPEYLLISELTAADQKLALLASAALPLGIVPSVTIRSTEYVDGGIADNLPVYPCLGHNVDEIFVIALEPESSGNSEAVSPRRWSNIQRLLELAAWPLPESRSGNFESIKNVPPKRIPLRPPPAWPSVKVFRPDNSLGWLATLNFRSAYARGLMRRGYQDTMQRLRGLR
jgi:predicted acylesterase/phospholipase RssA